LQLPATGYRWSRDLLSPVQQPAAFYCYTDGFGFVSPAGILTFDNVSRRPTSSATGLPTTLLQQGQAYQQLSYEDYLAK
jgi:hypothetical protein